MTSSLRRWFTRHPARWVLGVMLAMTLGGAQLVAACHQISHAFASDIADAGATTLSQGDRAGNNATQPGALAGNHDCPTCLLCAAMSGAATAPQGPVLLVAADATPTPGAIAHDFVPRHARIYASRAPPTALPAA